jgi:SP family general alpha glucoside:H+ symporter-like MFS transporter
VPDGDSNSRSPTMASYDENGNDGLKKTGNVNVGSIAGDEARQGTDHEHRLSFLEAIRLYPSAVGWTIYFSLGVRCCRFRPV